MRKVIKRTISKLLNWETGGEINAEEFLKKPFDELLLYRSDLQKAIEGYRDPLFVCYYCKQKVRIRGRISKTAEKKADIFHFAHLKDSKDCHIKTKNKFTKDEVERIKYNGVKESPEHQSLKERIAESLKKNEKTIGEVSKIEVEKVIRDAFISEWKKPDVNACFLKHRMAVELQLSTTWLDVITKRQQFYKNQKMFILWVFNLFDSNDDIRKLTYSDVVYTNNQNAFVFNEETYQLSIKANDLILKCYYKVYFNHELELFEDWKDTYVTLSQLTFDENTHCVYFHNSLKQKEDVLQEINEEKEKIIEEQRKKRIEEKAKSEKLLQLHSALEQLQSLLEDLVSEVNDLNSRNEVLNNKIEHEKKIIREIDTYTKETAEYISSDSYYSRPFYNDDDLLETLEKLFLDQLISIKQTEKTIIESNRDLKKKIESINQLKTVKINGKTYQSLNNKTDWHIIQYYFTQILTIEKTQAQNLFAESELKPVPNLNELSRLKFSDTKLFLIDLSIKSEELRKELQKNEQKLADQKQLKQKINEEMKQILMDYKKRRIQSIEPEIIEIQNNKRLLNIRIQEVEKEISSVNEELIIANH